MSASNRGLKAIMFTDVVGYSKLMGADERRALDVLQRHRQLVSGMVSAHNGTVHKELGDGTLSSFASAVDALHCARAIQDVLSRPGAGESFQLRIGLHVGDVVVEGGDLFGDGVNVASRIEGLAPPGGVALSGAFHSAVSGQPGLSVRSMGEQALKNIEKPVVVYVLEPSGASRASTSTPPREGSHRIWLALAAVIVVVIGTWVATGNPWPKGTPQDAAVADRPQAPAQGMAPAATTAPEKSIAVLPFADMSPEKDQEYFSDGMSEEVLNLLAKAPDLKVIARTSSFAFRGKDVPIAEIAKQLGVSHLLEGSVRKAGNTVRITAQLIRSSDSTHLWSETYDRPLDDVFKVQDEIAGAIAQALQIRMMGGNVERREGGTANLDAYQLYLRGLGSINESSAASLAAAIDHFERAIAIDPNFSLALLNLERAISIQANSGVIPPGPAYERCRQLIMKAMTISPGIGELHSEMQNIHWAYDWDWEAAMQEGRRALELDPNNPWILSNDANLMLTLGRWKDGERQALASLSRDPRNSFTLFALGQIYLGAGRLDDAEKTFISLLRIAPSFEFTGRYLARVYVAQGKPEKALEVLQTQSTEESRRRMLPIVFYALGRTEEADLLFQQQLAEVGGNAPTYVAMTYAHQGDVNGAMEWLERAYSRRDVGITEILMEPLFLGIRSEPRFKEFLRKLNLPETPPG